MSFVRYVPVSALLIVVVSAAPVRAEPTDPRGRASAHYARGVDLVKQGRYEEALEQFNQAYATRPHFAVLYNIGQTQIALGRPLAAIEALSSYLREGDEAVPADRREQVRAQIALLEAKLGELTISTDRPDVAIRVDDRDVGRTPLQPIRLAAGTHTVTASLPDGARITRVVALAEGERQRLDLALPGEASGAAPPAAAPPVVTAAPAVAPAAPPPDTAATLVSPPPTGASADAGPSRSTTLRRAAYVSAGLGVAAAGAALGVYLWNRDRFDDWKQGEAALQDLTPGSAAYRTQVVHNNDLAGSLTTANHAILGLSIAGGVLVAAGASLWMIDRGHGRSAGELAISCTGSSAQVGWSGRW